MQISSIRELLIALTGNEIIIGIFYSSWLFAVVLGAKLSLRFNNTASKILSYLYPFIALFTYLMFSSMRTVLNISTWEELSLIKSVTLIILANLPLGIAGGTLFVHFINEAKQKNRFTALSNGYFAESLGSVISGVIISTLLILNIKSFSVLVLMSIAYYLFVFPIAKAKRDIILYSCIFLFLFTALYIFKPAPKNYSFRIETPFQELATKRRHANLDIYANSKLMATFPERYNNDALAALIMSQSKTQARRILVTGFAQEELLKSLSMYDLEIDYHVYDKDYIKHLYPMIKNHISLDTSKIKIRKENIRKLLRENKRTYDAILIAHQGPSELSSNSYYTKELFALAKEALRPYGRIIVPLIQEENYIDKELALYGSSILMTLGANFNYSTIIPGKTHYFLASSIKDNISTKPEVLIERYTKIKPNSSIYAADSFYSLLQANRVKQLHEVYRLQTLINKEALINRDSKPSSYILNNIVTMRRNNIQSANFIVKLIANAHKIVYILMFLFFLIRFKYLTSSGESKDSLKQSNSLFYQSLSGFASLATYLILIYFFQIKFAQLYSYLGYISAFYMAGLSLGAILIKKLISKYSTEKIFTSSVIIQILFLLLIGTTSAWPFSPYIIGLFLLFMLIAGFIGGASYPIAESLINKADNRTTKLLEEYDYIGACIAGFSVSLFFIPFIGVQHFIFFLILSFTALLIYNIYINHSKKCRSSYSKDKLPWAILYLLIFITTLNIVLYKQKSPDLLESKSDHQYVETKNIEGSDSIYGYGGTINLALEINDNKIVSLVLKENNETPYYIRNIEQLLDQFIGLDICDSSGILAVDAISGATVSSNAVIENLINYSANNNQCNMLLLPKNKLSLKKYKTLFIMLIFLIVALTLKNFLKHPGRRTLFLILNALVLGIIYKVQYSSTDIIRSLDLRSIGFSLASVIAICTLLFGRHYCAFICPYGAMQELASKLASPKLNIKSRSLYKIKFFLLSAIMILAASSGSKFIHEPLNSLFTNLSNPIFMLSISLIIISVFIPRFWCRVLCPAGAFLSSITKLSLRLDKFFSLSPAKSSIKHTKRIYKYVTKDYLAIGLVTITTLVILVYNITINISSSENIVSPESIELEEIDPEENKSDQDITTPEAKPKIIKTKKKKIEATKGLKSAPIESLKFIIEKGHLSDRESMYYERLD